jgi:hypothetical protein
MISRVQNNQVQSEWFVALITQVGTVDTTDSKGTKGTPHAWTRLAPGELYQNNVDSDYPKIKGTLTDSPAYALDGTKAAVNDKVLMRYYGSPKGMPVYQFAKAAVTTTAPPATTGSNVVFVKPVTANTCYVSTWNGTTWVDSGAIAYPVVEANGNTLPLNKRMMALQYGTAPNISYLVTLDVGVVTDVQCYDGVLNVTRRM